MKLLKLILENFKGIKSLVFEPQGNDASIYGENGAGKTTIYDAFLWLLFGKNSQNQAGFQIKAFTESGDTVHNLNHTVEGKLLLEDGSTITLKKVYMEKWTKKKGSTKAEHTGHTTNHFINDVPVQAKEYTAKVLELMDEESFRLLTDVFFFNEKLHWQDRRRILLEVCGDLTDEEVIGSNKKLKKLPGILGSHTLEEYRKMIVAKKRKINEELDRIPVRIDEANLSLRGMDDLDVENIQQQLQELTRQYESLQGEIKALESGDTTQLKQQVRDLEEKRQAIKAEFNKEWNREQEKLDKEIQELRKEVMQLELKRDSTLRDRVATEKEVQQLESEILALRESWTKRNADQFTHEDSCSCPTCGQAIPEEQLRETRAKALASFNRQKASDLKEISTKGKEKTSRRKELQEKLLELETALIPTSKELTSRSEQLETLRADGKHLLKQQDEYRELKAYKDITHQIKQVMAEIENAKESVQLRSQGKLAELDKLKEQITETNRKLAQFSQAEITKARIKKLEEEQASLADEYEKLEEELFLTEEFIRTKVKVLEDKINSKFEMARFKLFEVQVNGGLTECCEATYKGVPFGDGLNHGKKVNLGLDIIKTLSKHYGITAPIFVDNAESVTKYISMDTQMIRLVVSEVDEVLRIEVKQSEQKKLKEAV